VIASLHGYITDSETGDAIVSAEVTIVEHIGVMEANVYRAFSVTDGFYSLENMAFENRPIIVDISVEAGGYGLIKETNVGLAEGDNTLNFDMVWRGGPRDVPSFISYQLPDQIVSGEEFPVSMTVYLPYQDARMRAFLELRLPKPGDPRFYTDARWELLPDTLYDGLTDKGDYIRFYSAGIHALEATGKAICLHKYFHFNEPLPPGIYDINYRLDRRFFELINGRLRSIYEPFPYKSGLVKVGAVEIT
ncbi:unnamed protein product, partial [marine sediment metagenome]